MKSALRFGERFLAPVRQLKVGSRVGDTIEQHMRDIFVRCISISASDVDLPTDTATGHVY